jgi:hypothetical protein
VGDDIDASSRWGKRGSGAGRDAAVEAFKKDEHARREMVLALLLRSEFL